MMETKIDKYDGKAVDWTPPLPVLPRPICGILGDQEAPAELKGPLILFSSGLDSTYLVYEALKTSNVHLLYVIGNLRNTKVKEELEAREKIKQHFEENPHSQYRIVSDTILRFEVGDAELMLNGVRLTQPATWMYPSLYFYKSGMHTSVQIAYVKDDIIIPHLNDLQVAWDSLTKVVKTAQIPLEFPHKDVDKNDSYKALPDPLKDLIWVCDDPWVDGNRNTIECKRCGPCIRRVAYLNNYKESQ